MLEIYFLILRKKMGYLKMSIFELIIIYLENIVIIQKNKKQAFHYNI